jgi:hypothetical protein
VDVDDLTEMFMAKLVKLDGVLVEGDLKLQRRVQVFLVLLLHCINAYSLQRQSSH